MKSTDLQFQDCPTAAHPLQEDCTYQVKGQKHEISQQKAVSAEQKYSSKQHQNSSEAIQKCTQMKGNDLFGLHSLADKIMMNDFSNFFQLVQNIYCPLFSSS